MSAQHNTGRRAAALAAAAKLGPMRDDVAEAIERQRAAYAEKRAARSGKPAVERRQADRRTGEFDRREAERRRFHTMDDKLAAAAKKHDEGRKFTGERHSAFGDVEPESPVDYLPGPQQINGA